MNSWDIDGTNPDELSRILAGKNKPFYRLIGAPYWAVRKSFGVYLQDAVELERMESSFTRKPDVEIMAEGDHQENDRKIAHDIKRIDPDELAEATRIQLKKVDKIVIGNDILFFDTLTVLGIA
jgi:hypothetical protein